MKNVKSRTVCQPVLLVLFIFSVSKICTILGKECESIDIRNRPSMLENLENCTVIKGSLVMVLIERNVTDKDYRNYQFPMLREVTDFVMFYQITRLSSFDFLFPNLTVIRGNRLFFNYALVIYSMPDLRTIGLNNLVEIQRGHVFIGHCPQLCHLDRINWDMLTKTPGVNHVKSNNPKDCIDCIGCDYCSSNYQCQKTKYDNLTNLSNNDCHSLCLGGCSEKTAADCLVCKGISDDGVCVEECPKNKFLLYDDFRCYDEKTCISYNGFMFNGECLHKCPSGYYANEQMNFTCVPCKETVDCTRICPDGFIDNLQEAEKYLGCSIIDGSLTIAIQNIVDVANLKMNLIDIREIRGYLKIYATSAITSLEFLGNLEKIQGDELEYDEFGLIIYGNKNLETLWNWKRGKNIELVHGGIFIHSNYKLCNIEVSKLQQFLTHNSDKDFVLFNDMEIDCEEGRLPPLDVEVKSHNTVSVYWKRNDIGHEIEIFYREYVNPITKKNVTHEADECSTETWIKEIVFPEEYKHNSTFDGYNITNLKQNTEYLFFMKTFRSEEINNFLYSAQSPIEVFRTFPDIPVSPIVFTKDKTEDSITLEWRSATHEEQKVIYYFVDIFINLDDQDTLDTRNYCDNPFNQVHEDIEQDYSGCCAQLEEEREDIEFISNMNEKFRCSAGFENICDQIGYEDEVRSTYYVRSVLIPVQLSNITIIDKLNHFTLYTFHFSACNNQGCGAYSLHSERTAPLSNADNISLEIHAGDKDNEFLLIFFQPKNPNGVTLSYTMHYITTDDSGNLLSSSKCITRLEHEKNNFKYLFTGNSTTNYNVRVSSTSLAGTGPYTAWVNLSSAITTHQSKILVYVITFTLVLDILIWMI